MYKLKEIQRYAKIKIKPGIIPTAGDIEELRIKNFLDKVKTTIDAGALEPQIKVIEKLMSEDISSMDIAAALVKMAMKEEESSAGEEAAAKFEPSAASNRISAGDMTRVFINAGKAQGVMVRDILGAITGETGIRGERIGRIDLFDKYSFVQIDSTAVDQVIDALKNKKIKGVRIFADRAKK
jgi:ATP-dependent RNA helicase DeaD